MTLQKTDEILRGLPIFNPQYAYGEFFRVICGKSYALNISNTKSLVVGFSPFKLSSKLRCVDNEMKYDFDYIVKINDVKYGNSMSIFGDEFELFIKDLEKACQATNLGPGCIIAETEYYIVKNAGDGFYECTTKNGKKIFKIAASSLHVIQQLQHAIEEYIHSFSKTHFLRIFLDIIDNFIKYEQESNFRIDNSQAIVDCIHIFNDLPSELKILYLDICFSFGKTIYQVMEYVKSLP